MIFTPTVLQGVFIIEQERSEDERGYFARTWCLREFKARGLNHRLAQCSTSLSRKQGTLRGMHYQTAPHMEDKLVRCIRGSVYDVVVDLRPDSPTYCRWTAAELTEESWKMVYVPAGCAHGFITLRDNTEVFYQISEFYTPAAVRGVRWNDPAFGIHWPVEITVISERDRSYPDFNVEQ